jgi:hypothetical protein
MKALSSFGPNIARRFMPRAKSKDEACTERRRRDECMETGMRGYHDMGGEPAGPVVRQEHDPALWEKRVDALYRLLERKGIIKVDELRRGIETLGAEAYDRMSYYERWIASVANALVQHGVITTDELGRRMAEVEARQAGGGAQ